MSTTHDRLAAKLHEYAGEIDAWSPSVGDELREIAYRYVPKVTYENNKIYELYLADGTYEYGKYDTATGYFYSANGVSINTSPDYAEIKRVEDA